MIGIIGAMDSEVNELKSQIKNLKVETISNMYFYQGELFGKEIVVAKCGIGKVFAAICAEAMILSFKPKKIIHIGIAGSLSEELGIDNVAIASSVVQHDVDQVGLGYPKGEVQGLGGINIHCNKKIVDDLVECAKRLSVKYKVGVIASGDQFISSSTKKDEIAKDFSAIATEMEGASTGQVCLVNGVDFGVVRAISDGSGDDSSEVYKTTKQQASDVSTSIILEYFKM